MYRVGLVSDTHARHLDQCVEVLAGEDLDYFIFLGDLYDDGIYIRDKLGLPSTVLGGNNDWRYMDLIDTEASIRLQGLSIFLCHGHKYGVSYSLSPLYEKGKRLGASLCLYGHSHVFSDKSYSGIRMINPGSASYPRGRGPRSLAVLGLDQGNISLKKISLDD